MAKTEHYITRFEEGGLFHVYNRSVDKQLLFRSESNYRFFLKQFHYYLDGVLTLHAFSLLDNHFHLVLKIAELSDFRAANRVPESMSIHEVVSKQFRLFFQSYALAFNKEHNRCGTLFQTPFKRVRIRKQDYLKHLVYYVHHNPEKHGLVSDFKQWKWSSYLGILNERNPANDTVVSWFGGLDDYIDFHSK